MGGARSNLTLGQLAPILGECSLPELVSVLVIVQLAVCGRPRSDRVFIASLVGGCIDMNLHCVFLSLTKKLYPLVMTFVSCQGSISLSDLRRAVAARTRVPSLRHLVAGLSPLTRYGSHGPPQTRVSNQVLTYCRMFFLHWEWALSFLVAKRLQIRGLFYLLATWVENVQLVFLRFDVDGKVDKPVLSQIA